MPVNETTLLREGTLLVLVPHMDDEALACGGTIAVHADPSRVHLLFATDGSRSPAFPFPRRGAPPGLPAIRAGEARRAARRLGIPEANLAFGGLPDGRLSACRGELDALVRDALRRTGAQAVLAPFRYDRHPDHLAVARSVHLVLGGEDHGPSLFEYFVYWRWRTLPGGDVRRYVLPERMIEVDISAAAERKRAALACYASQVTRYFPWQTRPVLTEASLAAACGAPERFCRARPGEPRTAVLARLSAWIPVAHRIETPAKRAKDLLAAPFRRLAGTS